MDVSSVEALRTEVRRASTRLRDRVGGWTPARWIARTDDGLPKGEVVYALVQQIADLTADAEGEPRRSIPRLKHDVALPDQLSVVVNDLLRATGDRSVLQLALEAIESTRRAL